MSFNAGLMLNIEYPLWSLSILSVATSGYFITSYNIYLFCHDNNKKLHKNARTLNGSDTFIASKKSFLLLFLYLFVHWHYLFSACVWIWIIFFFVFICLVYPLDLLSFVFIFRCLWSLLQTKAFATLKKLTRFVSLQIVSVFGLYLMCLYSRFDFYRHPMWTVWLLLLLFGSCWHFLTLYTVHKQNLSNFNGFFLLFHLNSIFKWTTICLIVYIFVLCFGSTVSEYVSI